MNLNESILSRIDALIEEFEMTAKSREQAKNRPMSTREITPGGAAGPKPSKYGSGPIIKYSGRNTKSKYTPSRI